MLQINKKYKSKSKNNSKNKFVEENSDMQVSREEFFRQKDADKINSQQISIKEAVASAPTYIPKNFFEQIVFYESGGVKKLYLYINNAWEPFTSD